MNANYPDLKGRAVIVTGAGGGIGRATALAFAAAGAKVIAADIAFANVQETASLAARQNLPGEVGAVQTDVADSASVQALVAHTITAHGRIDCAINNAGIHAQPRDLHELAEADWQRMVAVNLTGVFLCMKHVIPHMLKQGKGAIVNTASVSGLSGSLVIAYGASKHGVVGLTRSAARQYAARGIRINAVCPGATDTPMTVNIPRERRVVGPIGRTGQPEEIAAAMLWLCSDAASYVTGHALPVDGGWMAT